MARRLGLWSGIGVNSGVMIGTGVFVSAGFMAETMSPGLILLAWIVGGVVSIAGARAYAAVAFAVPRSGGEYRYLSDLFHPWLGTLAGWTSLLAGFCAPIATSAATAGPFASTLWPALDARLVGAGIIVVVTLAHAFHFGVSRAIQDSLAAAKLVLIAGFIVAGFFVGTTAWPAWSPRHTPQDGTLGNFMAQLVFVMYAYTGWNSAAYATDEFRDPRRTVPRSMVIAAAAVMLIYLAVNWVLVANLDDVTLLSFLSGDAARITLGHVITAKLVGHIGGTVMSLLVVVALISSVSAMTVVGPRIYQVMARDGYLPRAFAGTPDRPPLFSIVLQGGLALVIFATRTLAELMGDITVLLTITSALAAATLFKRRWPQGAGTRPGPLPLIAAGVYIAMSVWMLAAVFLASPRTLVAPSVVVVAATLAYFALKPRAGGARL